MVRDWSIRRWCHNGYHPSCGACPQLGFTRHRRLFRGAGSAGRMSATPALGPHTCTTIFRPLQTRATAFFILTGAGDCCCRMRERERDEGEWGVCGDGPDINGKDTRGENETGGQNRTSRKRKQELTIKGGFWEMINKQWSSRRRTSNRTCLSNCCQAFCFNAAVFDLSLPQPNRKTLFLGF